MYLQEQIERQEKFKEIFRTELASSFNAYEVLRLKQFKKYKFFQIMKKVWNFKKLLSKFPIRFILYQYI